MVSEKDYFFLKSQRWRGTHQHLSKLAAAPGSYTALKERIGETQGINKELYLVSGELLHGIQNVFYQIYGRQMELLYF